MLMDCTTCHGFDEFDDMGLQRADAPLHLYPIKTNDLCNFVDARDVPPWLCLATTDARCLGTTECLLSATDALWHAALQDDAEGIAALAATVDVDAAADDGYAALHLAAESDAVAALEMLCRLGADLEQRDADGRTPLFAAAALGHAAAAETLVLAGADVEAADVSGRTAFWAACALGELAVAELLAAAGADVDARDGDGLAALDFAAARGAADVLSFLRGCGAREHRCRLGV